MNVMIAVTNMTAANGGVTTHIVDLCRELVTRGMKVVLVSDENNCDYQERIRELEALDGFQYVSVELSRIQASPKHLLNAVSAVCKIVKEQQIDIIHAHSQSFCVVGALVKARTGVPYIWTNHIDEMANPRLFKKILAFLRFPIISVSSDLKNMLVHEFGVAEKRITVVNNGIDVRRFAPLTEHEKAELKEKFGCSDKYTVGLLARMSYGKGHMFLLQAINKVQKEHGITDIRVLIAGKLHDREREYLEALKTYANAHRIDLSFLGFQNPREVFGVCQVSTLPSIYEGFGLTVIESLAMGCPVIRSDTPGWMDTKDISLVFRKMDIDALAEHLYYAYTHPDEMKQMGRRGQQRVLERFTIERQVDETVSVYERYARI